MPRLPPLPPIAQSRYADLMQLGLQLFSRPFDKHSVHSAAAPLTPAVATAVQCVELCLSGKGTALGSAAAGAAPGGSSPPAEQPAELQAEPQAAPEAAPNAPAAC